MDGKCLCVIAEEIKRYSSTSRSGEVYIPY